MSMTPAHVDPTRAVAARLPSKASNRSTKMMEKAYWSASVPTDTNQ